MSGIKLSILIATVTERKHEFKLLWDKFSQLAAPYQGQVEVLSLCDDKVITIGHKRNDLLSMAKGDYIVFFDDDDWPYDCYIEEIMQALSHNPDCVGMLIHMTTNGENPQTCCHSFKYKKWMDKVDGYDYVRSVTHFNPVKRKLALQVRFPDIRYGEDHFYSKRITPICRNEYFINKKLFHYRYSNQETHNKKYGINNR